MPRCWRILFALLLVATSVMLVGCDGATSSGKSEPTPTPIPPPPVPEKPVYTVKRGTVVNTLSFMGRVAPSIEEELFFRESGRVKKVYLKRNDLVEKGTLLAELENDDLVRQLAQAEIELETAKLDLEKAIAVRQFAIAEAEIQLEIKKLQLAKAEATDYGLDVVVAEANLARALAGPSEESIAIAEREVEQAKNSLWGVQAQRDGTCGKTGPAYNPPACDAAEASVQRAEESVRIAELRLQLERQGPSKEEVAIARANYERVIEGERLTEYDLELQRQYIRLAELDLEQLDQEIDPRLAKEMERSELAVERLRRMVDNTRIESPIPGKVTSLSAYDGRAIDAYKTVFVVANESELEITAEPMSSQLQDLSEGMSAGIILSSYPGKELPAQIVQLPYPFGGGGGAALEEADKLTHISFDPLDLKLEPGDLVKVLVTLERKEDVLWLPPAAISVFAGRRFVTVEEDGRQRRVDVTIGIESSERIEITEGVEEGQIVVGQ